MNKISSINTAPYKLIHGFQNEPGFYEQSGQTVCVSLVYAEQGNMNNDLYITAEGTGFDNPIASKFDFIMAATKNEKQQSQHMEAVIRNDKHGVAVLDLTSKGIDGKILEVEVPVGEAKIDVPVEVHIGNIHGCRINKEGANSSIFVGGMNENSESSWVVYDIKNGLISMNKDQSK